jgi:hypothetical protein
MTATRIEAIPLTGRRTRLVPPSRRFVDTLYELAASNQIPWGWGGPETPRRFEESLWDGVLVQFAVEDLASGESLGLLRADGANVFHKYAYLSMILLPEYRLRVWPLEAAVLFANYLFRKYDIEHLYAESSEANFDQFRSGAGRMFEIEGRLRERVVVNGERQDLYILTISRDWALTEGTVLLQRLTSRRS